METSTSTLDIADTLRYSNAKFDIPTIYVYGPQEEKRVLIQELTGVSLTGRLVCSHEFRLRDTFVGGWVCDVSLIKNTYKDGKLSETNEVPFLSDIYDPQHAASVVAQAQRAILDPQLDLPELRKGLPNTTESDYDELISSDDCVCIKVFGAPCSFSFTVLPENKGRFASCVRPSKPITKAFLERTSAFNICILPYEGDLVHQIFLQFIKTSNFKKERNNVIFIKRTCGDLSIFGQMINKFAATYVVDITSKEKDLDNGSSTVTEGTIGTSFKSTIQSLVSQFEAHCLARLPVVQEDTGSQLCKPKKETHYLLNDKPLDCRKDIIMLILRYCDSLKTLIAMETEDSINRKLGQHLAQFSDALFKTQPKLVVNKPLKKTCNYAVQDSEDKDYWLYSIDQIKALSSTSKGKYFSQLMLGKAPPALVAPCQQNWVTDAMDFVDMVRKEFGQLIDGAAQNVLLKSPGLILEVT
ncbi:hypothetical protein DSO57_1037093 [Entomophthora muscae]|uniref:Uncharacterized protein n=1 Tax=Entomophthora muscae TaxID=34485 RepID=A0ACC2TKZ3_9FUNG|nr:hypothetical protein DSO57_1037093 [Entomophthora muscae]